LESTLLTAAGRDALARPRQESGRSRSDWPTIDLPAPQSKAFSRSSCAASFSCRRPISRGSGDLWAEAASGRPESLRRQAGVDVAAADPRGQPLDRRVLEHKARDGARHRALNKAQPAVHCRDEGPRVGKATRSVAAALRPSCAGISMSTTATSGRAARAAATTSAPRPIPLPPGYRPQAPATGTRPCET
jgi:hypothetical protein